MTGRSFSIGSEDGVIHEVKLTDKMESAHEFQLLYYLYYLKQKGIENLKGQIDYPKAPADKRNRINRRKRSRIGKGSGRD